MTDDRREIFSWVRDRIRQGDPELPPLKTFKPKFNLPVLNNYRKDPDGRYWAYWPKVSWESSRNLKSKISPETLKQMAIDTGFKDIDLLNTVCNDLKVGADIGCSAEYRAASTSTNAPSSYNQGEKVSDAICEWLDQGYAIGPLDRHEIPFSDVKVSGLMTKIKPNGRVRVILNLSKGDPCCVNQGINKEEFPTLMGSIKKFIVMLNSCGRGAEFSKNYTHNLHSLGVKHMCGLLR